MTDPRSVAVLGSCITRDSFNARFNPDHRRWYSVDAQGNQTSVIALMSAPVPFEPDPDDGLSEYDTWNVGSDLGRTFLADLVAAQPDYLLLDFFGDVHFGVLRLADGRYVTDNSWKLHRTSQYARLRDGATAVHPLDDEDGYVALWAEALDRFAAFVAENCPATRVVLHRGFYADRVVTGATGRPRDLRRHARLAPLPVRRLNRLWARLDQHALDSFGWTAVDLRAERYASAADHPWGAFWVHYEEAYYHRFLAELHAIDLAARLGPDLAERVEVIASAAAERNRNQARFVRAAVREADARIAELEQRGLFRAAVQTLRARVRR